MNLLQAIQDYNDRTGGSCGISVVELCVKTGISITGVKPLLRELHQAGKIQVREGINSKLIFPKTNA